MSARIRVQVTKVFNAGRKSLSVRLLSTGVVEKRYDPRRPKHVHRFHREVGFLRHLKGCPFAPTLVSVDEDRLTFKVSYCGTAAPDTPETRAMINKLLHALEREYGMVRKENVGKTVYSLGTIANATILNGQLFLIDWGSHAWILKRTKRKPPKPPAPATFFRKQRTV
jgi:hypothetical protein